MCFGVQVKRLRYTYIAFRVSVACKLVFAETEYAKLCTFHRKTKAL